LKTTGVAVVFCTHSPDEILAVADRLLVLQRGMVVHDCGLDGVCKSDLAMLMST
jgi:ABC-type sugar transport system ATPase subunit